MNSMLSVYVGLGVGVLGILAFILICGRIGEYLEQRQQVRTAPDVPARPQPAPAATAQPAPIANTAPKELIPTLTPALHLLVIGYTNGGKTTLLHELGTRWARQDTVIVCDPDAAPGMWPGCVVAGRGNNFITIAATIQQVAATVQQRREMRGRGVRRFADQYVLIDEYQDIAREVPGAREFVEDVLRRGRKLGIHLILGVQDKQVATLGFEGRGELRKNFSWVVEMRLRPDGTRQASLQANGEGPYTLLPVPTLPDLERLIVEIPTSDMTNEGTVFSDNTTNTDMNTTDPYQEAERLAHDPSLSANEIFRRVGGDRNAVLTRIRETRDRLAREERLTPSA